MDQTSSINAEVEHILEYLRHVNPGTEEYSIAAQNLKVLCEARTKKPASFVDPDTVLVVVGNIVGILMILQYERFNVVSTRALSLIVKPR